VFSSFNSLLNSAATLFCLDVYAPMRKRPVSDEQMIRVAKIASVVIALFSFIVAPLLQYAPDGLWQIIRIFTGFYNIPVIAIVIVGLFTKRVPAIAAKTVIVFHVISYGLLQFVFNDFIGIHFLHLYGILFVCETMIMLAFGMLRPTTHEWQYGKTNVVDLTPWQFAIPCAITLMSCVIGLYLLFSPIGLVNGLGNAFWAWIALLALINFAAWSPGVRRSMMLPASPRASIE